MGLKIFISFSTMAWIRKLILLPLNPFVVVFSTPFFSLVSWCGSYIIHVLGNSNVVDVAAAGFILISDTIYTVINLLTVILQWKT